MFISGEDFKVGPLAQDFLTMTTLTEIYMWMHIWVHKYIYMHFACFLNWSTVHDAFWYSALSSRSVVFKFFGNTLHQ